MPNTVSRTETSRQTQTSAASRVTTTAKPKTTKATTSTQKPATVVPAQTTEQTTVGTTAETTFATPAPETASTTEYILITDPENATLYSSSEQQQTTPIAITEYQTTPETAIETETTAAPSPAGIFTFVIVLIGAVVAAIAYIIFKRKEVAPGVNEKTAQEVTNVKDIADGLLYTQDGKVFVYLKIDGIPIDLYTSEQLINISRELSARLVQVKFQWKFLSATRPMDLKPILNIYRTLQGSADDSRKQLLELEESELMKIANSGGATERQHYAVIWGDESKAEQVKKNAEELLEILINNGIDVRHLADKEIVELLNIINNPTYTRLENRFDFDNELLQAILKE